MDGYPVIVLAPIFGLLANVFSQVLCAHTLFKKRFAVSIVIGVVGGLVASLVALNQGLHNYVDLRSTIPLIVVTLITYVALAFCYWAFLNLNITSLRIRVLRELLLSPTGRADYEAIATVYSVREIVDRRVDRLLNMGQLIKLEDHLRTGRRELLALERIVSLTRSFILPKASVTKGKRSNRT